MKNALIILSIIAAVLVLACTLQEKAISSLQDRARTQGEKLDKDIAINQNQGVVLQNIILVACKGDMKCAQAFVEKALTPAK